MTTDISANRSNLRPNSIPNRIINSNQNNRPILTNTDSIYDKQEHSIFSGNGSYFPSLSVKTPFEAKPGMSMSSYTGVKNRQRIAKYLAQEQDDPKKLLQVQLSKQSPDSSIIYENN